MEGPGHNKEQSDQSNTKTHQGKPEMLQLGVWYLRFMITLTELQSAWVALRLQLCPSSTLSLSWSSPISCLQLFSVDIPWSWHLQYTRVTVVYQWPYAYSLSLTSIASQNGLWGPLCQNSNPSIHWLHGFSFSPRPFNLATFVPSKPIPYGCCC